MSIKYLSEDNLMVKLYFSRQMYYKLFDAFEIKNKLCQISFQVDYTNLKFQRLHKNDCFAANKPSGELQFSRELYIWEIGKESNITLLLQFDF